jgi:hypothetical protein
MMGLFEDIGRKVGKLGHEAREATREQATARCADCETLVYADSDTCPECGSDRLVSRAGSGDEASSVEFGDEASSVEFGDEASSAESGDEASSVESGDEPSSAESGDEPTHSEGSSDT